MPTSRSGITTSPRNTSTPKRRRPHTLICKCIHSQGQRLKGSARIALQMDTCSQAHTCIGINFAASNSANASNSAKVFKAFIQIQYGILWPTVRFDESAPAGLSLC